MSTIQSFEVGPPVRTLFHGRILALIRLLGWPAETAVSN